MRVTYQPFKGVRMITFQDINMACSTKMFDRERKFVPVKIVPSGETDRCRFIFDKAIGAAFGNTQFVVMPVRMGREDWIGGGA